MLTSVNFLYYHIKQNYFLKHIYLFLKGMYIKKMCIKLRTGNADILQIFFTDFCSKEISSNYPTEFILYLIIKGAQS